MASSLRSASAGQAQSLADLPGAPVVVRHLDMRHVEMSEGIVDRIGERRHAAHVGTLAHSLGADRVVRRRCHREVGLPHRRLDCRSEEHTSELQSLMRISYAVFCLKKKT